MSSRNFFFIQLQRNKKLQRCALFHCLLCSYTTAGRNYSKNAIKMFDKFFSFLQQYRSPCHTFVLQSAIVLSEKGGGGGETCFDCEGGGGYGSIVYERNTSDYSYKEHVLLLF
jgi:hypothetical protein